MKFKRRGYKISSIVLAFFGLLSILLDYKRILVSLGLLISGFTLWFHRNPKREPQKEDAKYISPVDGRVDQIREESDNVLISIYLGITDVHAIRSPINGKIETTERYKGKNYPAQLTTLAEKNNSLSYNFENGDIVTVYTGIFARRLMKEVDSPVLVKKGDEIGFISFGSRCTIRINKENIDELDISEGSFIRSGETVIAN